MKGQMAVVEVAPVEAWTGSRALVHVPRGKCPRCGAPTVDVAWAEPTLFRHGGHGATRETVVEVCRSIWCHWSITRSVTEMRPT